VAHHSSKTCPDVPSVLKHLQKQGEIFGSAEMRRHADTANEVKPKLNTHDYMGNRIDVVEYTDSYHEIMRVGIESGVTSMPWDSHSPRCNITPHLHRAALLYMLNQLDPGPCCPIVMSFAATSTIGKYAPEFIKDEWMSKLLTRKYDPSNKPIGEKEGVTIGMSMTEKQSGSDVRTNTTRATNLGGGEYELTGHKWFTSAPNSDGFLTLAKVDGEDGKLSCFLVPRHLPDGKKNEGLQFQRLKDKLGDHSNASSEVEYRGAVGFLMGEEGRGVGTIIDMVHHTRLECGLGSAGAMDKALSIAKGHVERREAFGEKLVDQPLMRHLIMDLELESKAATLLSMRMARSFDDPGEAHLGRIGVPVKKFFLCKKQPNFVYECMEVVGGNGYTESWPLARMFRASPLNSIWEGR
jgi:putative acyl-CoA dehydrogenase